MLKIGEFSRLAQVTVRALHHYDKVGLLHPAHIDDFTNYRYYTVEQLPRLHRIMALKELGLSLEQISLMIDADLPAEQIRGMLNLRQAEIQQRLHDEQERLQRVKFHLRMIEMESQLPALDVVIKEIPSLYALTLRRSMKPQNMVALGVEFEEAADYHNIQLTGPVTEIRFEEEFQFNHDDVEFVWPVPSSQVDAIDLKTFGTLQPKLVGGLPLVASYIVHGANRKQYGEILPIFRRWIVGNGYELRPTHRLVFHRGPVEHAEYEDWIIEFQHEIARTDDNAIQEENHTTIN
jgi:DNA-binding transcriptional MerR regulator